jgi:hypothetical protein
MVNPMERLRVVNDDGQDHVSKNGGT